MNKKIQRRNCYCCFYDIEDEFLKYSKKIYEASANYL